MRLLFEMDKKDYEHCTHRFVRNSARSIIIGLQQVRERGKSSSE